MWLNKSAAIIISDWDLSRILFSMATIKREVTKIEKKTVSERKKINKDKMMKKNRQIEMRLFNALFADHEFNVNVIRYSLITCGYVKTIL